MFPDQVPMGSFSSAASNASRFYRGAASWSKSPLPPTWDTSISLFTALPAITWNQFNSIQFNSIQLCTTLGVCTNQQPLSNCPPMFFAASSTAMNCEGLWVSIVHWSLQDTATPTLEAQCFLFPVGRSLQPTQTTTDAPHISLVLCTLVRLEAQCVRYDLMGFNTCEWDCTSFPSNQNHLPPLFLSHNGPF